MNSTRLRCRFQAGCLNSLRNGLDAGADTWRCLETSLASAQARVAGMRLHARRRQQYALIAQTPALLSPPCSSAGASAIPSD